MAEYKNYIGDYDYYRKQGFEEHELWIVRKTDCMFNRRHELTEKELERYYIMCKYLRL